VVLKKTVTKLQEYSESIVNTVREPLIVLDQDLRVITVSRSFYEVFKVKPEETVGQRIYDLGNKQWDIPRLRELLEDILPQKATFDDYEVEHDFVTIGRRTMLLNARRIPNPPQRLKVILLAIEDITVRKKREESNLGLAAIVNTSLDGIIGKTLQGDIVSWNKGAEKIYGYTEKEMQGKNISLLAPPDYQEEILSQLKKLQAGELIKNYETKRVRKDGVVIDISLTLSAIKDTSGHIYGVSAIMHDITEQKKAEQLLTVSEYSESIINTVREPLIVLDQDLRVVTVSRSFYDFFKVKPEETVGQLIYDLGNKQWDIPKLRELLEDILPKKATFDNYEVEHNFADIGRRIMLLNARQIQRASGKERIILLAIEDITERKEIEAGLEKTRKELEVIKQSADEASEFAESVINTVREPLISLNQDLRVVTVSRSFYEFFKVKPEETVGQLIYDLGNRQWDIPKLRELLEDILPKKATFDNYEVEHDFADIGRRIMLLNARQIQRASGKERTILLAIEDITERKKIENGLEKAHEELNELATELKRTSRVKSEFLANMSHELRTPLNSINGFSEVLYDETFGVLNEKQKKYVNNVLTSGKHLLLLINQILDMAKVESGKMKLTLSVLPMKSLLNEISLLVADMVSKKKIEMLLEIAADLPDIEADELKVKEIIYNLLSNAVKFTPEGGRIGMRARKTDSKIEVVVWDTGEGIAAENMEKIFEGFFRVDTPYSRVTEGTGLGLPLSKKMVELHGGKLFVESEGLNKGTSVKFTLPIISGGEA
jgi:two-component system CheB/CheR fusion protein